MMTTREPEHDAPSPARPLRVALFGMRCAFTSPILDAVIAAPGVEVVSVVIASREIPRQDQASDPLSASIQAHGVPSTEIRDHSILTSAEFHTHLAYTAPDIIVVACFPWRLPAWILALPPRGCVNVHPSLLPDGRGPEPVFWAFRWGLEETGVTLHLMDEGLDTGPVIAQRQLVIPDDATLHTLEASLARLGGEILVGVLTSPTDQFRPAPQRPDNQARYARFPDPDDLVVTPSWRVRDASRFIQAVSPVYGATVITLSTGQRIATREVVKVRPHATIRQPLSVRGDLASVQFSDGVLVCRVNATRQPLHFYPRHT